MLHIAPAAGTQDIAAVRALMLEYQALIGVDLSFQGFEAELRALPGDYAPPRGCLLLARHAGATVGCAALRPRDPARAEMKRLFVRPAARGLGAGQALVSRIVDAACAIGYREILLDTLPSMTEAQRLYEQAGFCDIPAYCANPIPGTRYLAKTLP